MRSLTTFALLMIACGPTSTTNSEREAARVAFFAQENSPSDPLVLLRAHLDRARQSTSATPMQTGPVDASMLVGMTRTSIELALGDPGRCRNAPMTSCSGLPQQCVTRVVAQPAPCQTERDIFYSFYHLPEGWSGGGPELLLAFESDRCVSADWRFTQ